MTEENYVNTNDEPAEGKECDDDAGEQLYQTVDADPLRGKIDTERRDFMKMLAVAGGAAATGGIATKHPSLDPVGEAQAAPPVIVGAGLIVGSAAVGYGTAGMLARDDDGRVDEDEYEDAVQDTAHQTTYNGVQSLKELEKSVRREYEEVIENVDSAGAFASNLWSQLRAETFSARAEGDSESAAINRVGDAVREEASDRIEYWLEEWNNYCREQEHERYVVWRKSLVDDGFSEISVYDRHHSDRQYETYSGYSDTHRFFGSSVYEDEELEVPDFEDTRSRIPAELPDGREVEVEVAYAETNSGHGTSDSNDYVYWPAYDGVIDVSVGDGGSGFVDEYYAPEELNPEWSQNWVRSGDDSLPIVEDPYAEDDDEAEHVGMYDSQFWDALINTAWEFHDDLQSDIPDYVSEVYSNYTQEEAELMEILTGEDIVEEFGDDSMGRTVAEYLAAGFGVPADDVTATAVLEGEEDGQLEGILLLDVDDEYLRPWEYDVTNTSYDSDADETTITVEIDDSSVDRLTSPIDEDDGQRMDWIVAATDPEETELDDLDSDDPMQVVSYDEYVEEIDEVDEEYTGDHTVADSVDVTLDGEHGADDITIYRDIEATVKVTSVPEGTVITPGEHGVNSAILVQSAPADGGGYEGEPNFIDGEFEVVEVIPTDEDDELEELRYETFATRTSVPERADWEMQREAEGRQETYEILVEYPEVDDIFPGMPDFDFDELPGGVIVAGVATVIAYLALDD